MCPTLFSPGLRTAHTVYIRTHSHTYTNIFTKPNTNLATKTNTTNTYIPPHRHINKSIHTHVNTSTHRCNYRKSLIMIWGRRWRRLWSQLSIYPVRYLIRCLTHQNEFSLYTLHSTRGIICYLLYYSQQTISIMFNNYYQFSKNMWFGIWSGPLNMFCTNEEASLYSGRMSPFPRVYSKIVTVFSRDYI